MKGEARVPPAHLATLAAALAPAWVIPVPWRLTALAGGTNNRVYRLETSAQDTYILRVYENHADAARLRYEHAIIAALEDQRLPFAVPAPIPTRAGEPFARLPDATGTAMLATLTPFFPGDRPNPGDLAQTEAAGWALATLDVALARVMLPAELAATAPLPMGLLRRRLGLAPDGEPLATLAALGVPDADRTRLAALLHTVEREMPALYAALPRQIIHSDYDPGNVLMEDTHVSAILDFEFAGPDLRVAELAAPLTWWPARFLGTRREWDVIAAFGRGYAAVLPLTPDELDAIPALLRLRAIVSLLHRLTRYQQRRSDAPSVHARVAYALERAAWLAANRDHLLDVVHGWRAS
jgi:homoserine kinase type II